MNKKIFTLLAASLMLLVTAFAANAGNGVGPKVNSLPDGVGLGAYHLKVTNLGYNNPLTGDSVLALDGNGHVFLADSLRLFDYGSADSTYLKLRQALWCVNVDRENQGKRPTFVFTNKEYGLDLSIASNNELSPLRPSAAQGQYMYYGQSSYQDNGVSGTEFVQFAYMPNTDSSYVVGGDQSNWRFSYDYSGSLSDTVYLAIADPNNDDYYFTLAWKSKSTNPNIGDIQLVRAHAFDLHDTAHFYKEHLILFSLHEAAPRVLSVEDFNSNLASQSTAGNIQLTFTPDAKNTDLINPFTEYTLTAEKGQLYSNSQKYLKLKATNGDAAGKYISVIYPGNDGDNYINTSGKKYLKLGMVEKGKWSNDNEKYAEFRFVYYPSADNVIINARRVDHRLNPQHAGSYEDVTGDPYTLNEYGTTTGILLYNEAILDGLIVRAQTLDNTEDKIVVTVDDRYGAIGARISFGVGDCTNADKNRTSVATNLYVIKDSRGRYLSMPLYTGDFTPQWVSLAENEDPFKTPAFQWLVVRISDKNESSKVHIINREFEDVQFNYTQIYKTDMPFNGDPVFAKKNGGYSFSELVYNALISASSFIVVEDDKDAKAVYDAAIKAGTPVPSDIWEKLYRTSPYLGYKYIGNDTLNYYSYSFNYLYALTESLHLGFGPEQKISDTTMYAVEGAQYFELTLPDTIRANGDEEYGIGYLTNTIVNTKAVLDLLEKGKAPVAKLVRRYYHLRINDVNYWNYTRNDNFLCLDANKRYGYTSEANALSRELPASKFYLRFTYQPAGKGEYYTLLDRINKSDFEYLNKEFGLQITDTLKQFDASHNDYSKFGFGVVQLAIDDNNFFAIAQPKTVGARRVSTFALSRINEPLYRRFNSAADDGGEEGSDAPRLLKFYEERNHAEYLVEDRMGPKSYIPGYVEKINYLGTENVATRDKQLADDPLVHAVLKSHNYAFYVDTAYINRGTGWIKPQYLIVLEPTEIEALIGCSSCGVATPIGTATYGRYLINATDSARPNGMYTGQNKPVKQPNGGFYASGNWERLIFVPAIHIQDTLFIFRGLKADKGNPDISAYMFEGKLDLDKLNRAANAGIVDRYTDLGDNKHKDYVFQFRYVERQYDQFGNKTDAGKHFLIESETTNRSPQGRMIAPMNGGWVKIDNEVVVISRGAYDDAILEAEWFNVEPTTDAPLATETIDASKVTVVAGKGNVSILNASGKTVVISNVLGQIVTKTVLTSDNASIAAPAGLVVVAVDGEDAVKAIVK